MHIMLNHITDACQGLVFQSSILFVVNNKRMYHYLSLIPMKGLNGILNHKGKFSAKSRIMMH